MLCGEAQHPSSKPRSTPTGPPAPQQHLQDRAYRGRNRGPARTKEVPKLTELMKASWPASYPGIRIPTPASLQFVETRGRGRQQGSTPNQPGLSDTRSGLGRRGAGTEHQIGDAGRPSVLCVYCARREFASCPGFSREGCVGAQCGSTVCGRRNSRMPVLSAGRAASGSWCVGRSPRGHGGHFSQTTAGGIFGMMGPQLTLSSNSKGQGTLAGLHWQPGPWSVY